MSVKLNIVVATLFSAVPAIALAGSCAAPTSLHPQEPGRVITGNTCDGSGETGQLNIGGLAVPHASHVYRFTYNNDATGTITVGPSPRELIITSGPSCNGVEPVLIAAEGVAVDIASAGLVNGSDYYLIVTSDNTLPSGTCGEFTWSYETLPVELQSFSID